MDSERIYKEVLRRNRTYILNHLDNPVSLADHLISSSNIFTELHQERISCERISRDRNRVLLDTVNKKCTQLYEPFLASLCNEDSSCAFIYQVLKQEELFIKIEFDIEQKYIDQTGGIVLITGLLENYTSEIPESDKDIVELKRKHIIIAVKTVYPMVEVCDQEEKFIHLTRRDQICPQEKLGEDMADCKEEILRWDVSQVCDWLRNENIVSEQVVKDFEEEEINGEALLLLTMDDLKSNIKTLKLGPRKILMTRVQSLKSEKENKSTILKRHKTMSVSVTNPRITEMINTDTVEKCAPQSEQTLCNIDSKVKQETNNLEFSNSKNNNLQMIKRNSGKEDSGFESSIQIENNNSITNTQTSFEVHSDYLDEKDVKVACFENPEEQNNNQDILLQVQPSNTNVGSNQGYHKENCDIAQTNVDYKHDPLSQISDPTVKDEAIIVTEYNSGSPEKCKVKNSIEKVDKTIEEDCSREYEDRGNHTVATDESQVYIASKDRDKRKEKNDLDVTDKLVRQKKEENYDQATFVSQDSIVEGVSNQEFEFYSGKSATALQNMDYKHDPLSQNSDPTVKDEAIIVTEYNSGSPEKCKVKNSIEKVDKTIEEDCSREYEDRGNHTVATDESQVYIASKDRDKRKEKNDLDVTDKLVRQKKEENYDQATFVSQDSIVEGVSNQEFEFYSGKSATALQNMDYKHDPLSQNSDPTVKDEAIIVTEYKSGSPEKCKVKNSIEKVDKTIEEDCSREYEDRGNHTVSTDESQVYIASKDRDKREDGNDTCIVVSKDKTEVEDVVTPDKDTDSITTMKDSAEENESAAIGTGTVDDIKTKDEREKDNLDRSCNNVLEQDIPETKSNEVSNITKGDAKEHITKYDDRNEDGDEDKEFMAENYKTVKTYENQSSKDALMKSITTVNFQPGEGIKHLSVPHKTNSKLPLSGIETPQENISYSDIYPKNPESVKRQEKFDFSALLKLGPPFPKMPDLPKSDFTNLPSEKGIESNILIKRVNDSRNKKCSSTILTNMTEDNFQQVVNKVPNVQQNADVDIKINYDHTKEQSGNTWSQGREEPFLNTDSEISPDPPVKPAFELSETNRHVDITEITDLQVDILERSKRKDDNLNDGAVASSENTFVETPVSQSSIQEINDIMIPKIDVVATDNETDTASKISDLLSKINEAKNDLYPILVANSPSIDSTTSREKLGFLGHIPWKVAFDFGPGAELREIFENSSKSYVNIEPSTDKFNPKASQNVQTIKEEIESVLKQHFTDAIIKPHWIHCNGYLNEEGYPPMDVKQWNMQRRFGLREAISMYHDLIPRGRAFVIMLGFANKIDVMIEAMTEFITAFPDQWAFIYEDEDKVFKPIQEELSRRNFIDETDLNDKSALDPSWNLTHQVVSQLHSHHLYSFKLPCLDGLVETDRFWVNKLSDLQILSANECEEYMQKAEEKHELKPILEKEELTYYNGSEVSWLNFAAESHICERDIERNLNQQVGKALEQKIIDDNYVQRIMMYHQPGAGGTTVAKHVLWNFRKKFRCAIVSNISEHTIKQIEEFRSHLDKSKPKPVLLLLDNFEEEERANLLVTAMEEKAKQIIRKGPENDGWTPVCVFLICLRRTRFPSYQTQRTNLGHYLSKNEKDWWKMKFNELEERKMGGESEETKIDPHSLISFNIMKNNFSKDFIHRMTKKLVEKIEHKKEQELLKYVSLLNAYDLNFKPLPTSSFDVMMMDFEQEETYRDMPKSKGKTFLISGIGPTGWKLKSKVQSWTSRLSTEFRLLMNDPSPYSKQSEINLRITNALLSTEILDVLRELEGRSQTTSAIALQFLGCNEIFNIRGIARKKIVSILVDMLKKRERVPSGKHEKEFSPMIQHIIDTEGVEQAYKVLERVFVISKDAFIAQHIARLNIYSQNWDEAERYAVEATKILPDNSALWDTCGRIYKKRLAEINKNNSKGELGLFRVVELIKLAHKGVEYFRKAQIKSEEQTTGYSNNAGFFGQLELTLLLFHCLCKVTCFKSKDELAGCLTHDILFPHALESELKATGDDYETRRCLKDIVQGVEPVIGKLEDEKLHLKEPYFIDEYRSNSVAYNNERLDELKANLHDYQHVEESFPQEITPEEASKIRRIRTKILGGNTFWSILDLISQTNGEENLMQIKLLCEENIESIKANAEDYEAIIGASLALVHFRETYKYDLIRYPDLSKWSKILFGQRDTFRNRIHLEPYLFHVMFNWPRKNSEGTNIPERELKDILKQWKSDYYEKYPRQRHFEGNSSRKEGTTIYFFANGSGMSSIIHHRQLRVQAAINVGVRGDAFWREPYVLRELQRFEGTLKELGDEVEVQLEYGNGMIAHIHIPTSIPIIDHDLWHRRVNFTIGLTWFGPKAYDIRREYPLPHLLAVGHSAKPKSNAKEPKAQKRQRKQTYLDMINKLGSTDLKLNELDNLKKERQLSKSEEKDRHQLLRERRLLLAETQKIMQMLEEF